MTDARAISAQLVDIRNVGAHKCVKLTIHVPEEQALRITELFGWPTGAAPVPVALARMEVVPTERHQQTGQPDTRPPQESVTAPAGAQKSRRAFHELPYAQQAALRCNDPIYRAFLREMCARTARDEDDAAEDIRDLCGVESRRDIRPDTEAEKSWLELEQWFAAWQTKERAMA